CCKEYLADKLIVTYRFTLFQRLREQGGVGSNPVTPTIRYKRAIFPGAHFLLALSTNKEG
ncbi:MAG: hypothetical protein OEU57_15895, partial [Desulfuromonadales bacterium]|nr:hypothetical protein [Desulfuromonadales bacterium]